MRCHSFLRFARKGRLQSIAFISVIWFSWFKGRRRQPINRVFYKQLSSIKRANSEHCHGFFQLPLQWRQTLYRSIEKSKDFCFNVKHISSDHCDRFTDTLREQPVTQATFASINQKPLQLAWKIALSQYKSIQSLSVVDILFFFLPDSLQVQCSDGLSSDRWGRIGK
jgi:hypothetical protein